MTTIPDDVEAVAVSDAPARLSGALAVLAAGAAAVLAWPVTGVGFLVGLAGTVVLAVGVGAGASAAVTAGAAGAFAAAVVAGLADAPVPTVVAGTLAAVLAWDLGEQAVTLGAQVGREPSTWRGELGHALASLAVGGAAAIGAVAVYRVATGGLTTTALAALAAAALLLTAALRP